MKQLVLVLLLLCPVFCKKENLDELSSLLNDPKLLFELRKRFGNLLDDVIEDENVRKPEVGCYSLSDTLNGDCAFHTNGSTIIKTTESMGNGAKFLANLANVSCPRNCTAACCGNKECDTAVFQDKKEHNCYLFQCGHPSKCVFVGHEDFWMSSISKDVHETHKFTPGGATPSHENELENLGSPEPSDEIIHTTVLPDVITTKAPRPEKVPVTSIPRKPGLGQPCPSYKTKCEDPHAGCRGNICRCNVGYHQKHGVCRTHCPIGDFECENIGYGSKVVQCVPGSAVCDGNQDCEDWSDEYNCTTDNEGKTDTITPNPVHVLGNKEDQTGVKPTKAPSTAIPVIRTSTAGHIEEVPVTTNKPAITKSTVVSDQVSKEKEPSESNQAEDTKQNGLLENEGKTVDDSADESENNKSTESTQDTDSNDENPFRILNADKIEVDTYTDSSQGPIVALALGLAITMMLLIFVGCRLRTVKRRLRKGRALHSNEADYLINGMYL